MPGYWPQLRDRLSSLLLLDERRCVLCHGVYAESPGVPFCKRCRVALTKPPPGWCPSCGRLYAAPGNHRCGECVLNPPPWSGFGMIGRYEGALRDLLLLGKFQGDGAALHGLGLLLTTPAAQLTRPDAIVPMPLHPARLRERGFNQSQELARPASAALCVPLRPELLQRRIHTAPQRGLSAVERRHNLRGAFAAKAEVCGLRILLVDDVATTGTTLRKAAKILRQAGAVVDVLVVARA